MSALKSWLKNSHDGLDEYYVFTRLTEYKSTKKGEKEIFYPVYVLQYDSPNGRIQSVDISAVKILFFWILLPIELIQKKNIKEIDWRIVQRIGLLSNLLFIMYNTTLAISLLITPWWLVAIAVIPSLIHIVEIIYPYNNSMLLSRIFHFVLPNFYLCKIKNPD